MNRALWQAHSVLGKVSIARDIYPKTRRIGRFIYGAATYIRRERGVMFAHYSGQSGDKVSRPFRRAKGITVRLGLR